MTAATGELSWPAARLGEALAELATAQERSGRTSRRAQRASPASIAKNPGSELLSRGGEELEQWIERACARLGLEAEPVGASYAEVLDLVRGAAPAVLWVRDGGSLRIIVLLGTRRRTVEVLCPDTTVARVPAEELRDLLCQQDEAPLQGEIERLLERAAVPLGQRPRTRAALLRQQLASSWIETGFLIRLAPGDSPARLLRSSGAARELAGFLATHAIAFLLFVLAWWMVGRGALEGRLDRGWLWAWALVLATLLPFRLLSARFQGRFSVSAGALLKRRLLDGALRLEPEEIREQGAGRLLGRVLESEAFETLALSGGLLAVAAVLELVLAAAILWRGASGGAAVALLLLWCILVLAWCWRYAGGRRHWTSLRLGLTGHLVAAMVGHRTRLVQQPRARWHEGEDDAVREYHEAARDMDRAAVALVALIPRGWLILGLLSLTPAFVGAASTRAALAVGLGGVLLAWRALHSLAAGLSHLVGAAIAWQQVAPLFAAAARTEPPPALEAGIAGQVEGRLLDGNDLRFAHRARRTPVLDGVELRVDDGDRILLEGPSGGGKSTLVALLTALRTPAGGVLLLRGWDRYALGSAAWRRRVVAAPQFHENHVLSETLAFNLLMGRGWPPRPGDLTEARDVCRELGLGELLERMPGGLYQRVGETGWQLSHGERSRVFIARALLQRADLVILDESFAPLDPENPGRVLDAVLTRSPSLLVVAHQ